MAEADPHDIIYIISPQDSSEKNPLYVDLERQLNCEIRIHKSTRDIVHDGAWIKAILFDSEITRRRSVFWNRKAHPSTFLAVYQPGLASNPKRRYQFFQSGANMVAYDTKSIADTLSKAVLPASRGGGFLQCPFCPLSGLTEDELWHHMPAFHINIPNEKQSLPCPVCGEHTRKPLQVHVHDDHGPDARSRLSLAAIGGNTPPVTKQHTILHSYALVVCRHPQTGDLLLCQEFGDQGFWTPGGAVEKGETLEAAAIRETMEEAGMDVVIKGILNINYVPRILRNGVAAVQLRAIFYAEPADLTQLPKSIPDFESVGAAWCSHESIMSSLKLRGREPQVWSEYLQRGGTIYPLSLLGRMQNGR